MQLEEVFSSRTSHTQDILLDFSLDKRQDETLLSLESGWGQAKLPGVGRYILVGPSPLGDQWGLHFPPTMVGISFLG